MGAINGILMGVYAVVIHSRARGLNFGQSIHLHPHFVYVSS